MFNKFERINNVHVIFSRVYHLVILACAVRVEVTREADQAVGHADASAAIAEAFAGGVDVAEARGCAADACFSSGEGKRAHAGGDGTFLVAAAGDRRRARRWR